MPHRAKTSHDSVKRITSKSTEGGRAANQPYATETEDYAGGSAVKPSPEAHDTTSRLTERRKR